MTLNELKPGQRAIVAGWRSGVAPGRLMEMGLLQGTEIEIVRFAPLGDPIDIKLRGYHLSLRRAEAEQIEVNPR